MNRSRHGFSLLEVLLATGLLVGSLIVLADLASIGRRHADDAQQLTAAQAGCETRLNEILAGLQPAESVEDQPLESLPGWLCSVNVDSLRQPGLIQVRVTVKTEAEALRRREFTLVHWMSDPAAPAGDPAGPARPLPDFPGGTRP
jgi:Tfp pilus assembly protein PilV